MVVVVLNLFPIVPNSSKYQIAFWFEMPIPKMFVAVLTLIINSYINLSKRQCDFILKMTKTQI